MKVKLLITIATLVSLTLVGCFNGEQGDKKESDVKNQVVQTSDRNNKKYSNRISFKEHGFQFYLNDQWKAYLDNGLMYIMDIEYPTDFSMKFITIDDYEKVRTNSNGTIDIKNYEKDLFIIKVVDKNNDIIQSNLDELSKKYQKQHRIGTNGVFNYYMWFNEKFDTSNLSDRSKEQIYNIEKGMDDFIKNIELFRSIDTEAELEKLKKIEFKGKTMDAKDVDGSIFKNSKITIIECWQATKLGEHQLGKLQELYKANKDKGVNVIGIILNGDEERERAEAILNYNSVTFTNIILDKEDRDKIDRALVVTPMRIFVDNKGNIIGKGMVKEDFKEELEKRIEMIKSH